MNVWWHWVVYALAFAVGAAFIVVSALDARFGRRDRGAWDVWEEEQRASRWERRGTD